MCYVGFEARTFDGPTVWNIYVKATSMITQFRQDGFGVWGPGIVKYCVWYVYLSMYVECIHEKYAYRNTIALAYSTPLLEYSE